MLEREELMKKYLHQLRHGQEMARAFAAQELGKLRDAHALEALVEAMKRDPSPLVRRYATAALGDLGDGCAVEALSQALQDPVVAWHAAQALRRIGTPAALKALEKKALREGL